MSVSRRIKSVIFKQPHNMEKTIKMSLETAREIYKEEIRVRNENSPIAKLLKENFTKEELEWKREFTWEESFDGDGYYICQVSAEPKPIQHYFESKGRSGKNIFQSKKQALSALAFAQLSHIVARYNEGKSGGAYCYSVMRNSNIAFADVNPLELVVSQFNNNSIGVPHLVFLTKEDAEQSLITNTNLWIQYWML